jgi:hypothetical protein
MEEILGEIQERGWLITSQSGCNSLPIGFELCGELSLTGAMAGLGWLLSSGIGTVDTPLLGAKH